MTDVVCVGQPFLDLRFLGLRELPRAGEERTGADLRVTPGGSATIAIGCARLGLSVRILAPIAQDHLGGVLASLLAGEGIPWEGPATERCAVSVAVPVDGERAMITFDPRAGADLEAADRARPRAIVADLAAADRRRTHAALYAVVGDEDALALRAGWRAAAAGVTALLVNRSEARHLTGLADPRAAAVALAEVVPTAVVTLGADGCVAATRHETVMAGAPSVEVGDTTGAGDLFAAAYVWGDLDGMPLRDRLAYASLYASLALQGASPVDAAPTREALFAQAAERGLGLLHIVEEEV
jgi:ribokinase